jgi:hypothetical protein
MSDTKQRGTLVVWNPRGFGYVVVETPERRQYFLHPAPSRLVPAGDGGRLRGRPSTEQQRQARQVSQLPPRRAAAWGGALMAKPQPRVALSAALNTTVSKVKMMAQNIIRPVTAPARWRPWPQAASHTFKTSSSTVAAYNARRP